MKLSLDSMMSRVTLRQLSKARELWRQHVGDDGPGLSDVLQEGENGELYYEALAAMVAGRMFTSDPSITVERALDLELDTDEGDTVDPTTASSDAPLVSSLASTPD